MGLKKKNRQQQSRKGVVEKEEGKGREKAGPYTAIYSISQQPARTIARHEEGWALGRTGEEGITGPGPGPGPGPRSEGMDGRA